jgi:mRNA interferase MazF
MAKSSKGPPLRGQVFDVQLSVGRKPLVVVSNNNRNRALPSVIAARITTAPKPSIPSIVEIPKGEPVVGRVVCDDVHVVPSARLLRMRGAFSPSTMRAIENGLREALAL